MKELEIIDETSLPTFVRRWYGEPDRKVSDIDSNIQMPNPLRNWYRLASQWSVSLSKYNHFSAPGELRFDGDKMIFWDENQGACSWATDSGGKDPLVYESEHDEGGDWKSTDFRLSNFLLYVAVSEAVHGNQDALVNLDMNPEDYESVTSHFRRLSDPLWSYPHPNWCYMYGEQLLAYGSPDKPSRRVSDKYRIIISASHPKALESLPMELFTL